MIKAWELRHMNEDFTGLLNEVNNQVFNRIEDMLIRIHWGRLLV